MSTVDLLRQVPLFEGMTDHAMDAVAELVNEVAFADGQPITREGEAGDAFYVVVDGRLRISRAGVDIASQGPGDFLGEISLIDGRPRTATATAVGPVNALAIERLAFMSLIDRYPAVRISILMALTDRIRRDEREKVM
jgi:CRP/FNR family transcriptional regulator, cyclic AMP receptor protein